MRTKAIITIFSVFAGVTIAQAQTQVRGRVTNKDQKAVSDITVRIGNKKTITNHDGHFEIFVPQSGDFSLFLDGISYKENNLRLVNLVKSLN